METVRVHLGAGLRANVESGGHQWVVDEPKDGGGEGAGPDPYELLLSALGACKAMTVRLYADRKGWDLQWVRVELGHSRSHVQDCDDCTGQEEGSHIDHIRVSLSFGGDLDETQRARLAEIADRCPVHRTLRNRPRIVTA